MSLRRGGSGGGTTGYLAVASGSGLGLGGGYVVIVWVRCRFDVLF